ncbi:hypothetical protein BU24DRAFT_496494 [Aaosphaeria arxii CBS 175.79]|uniref:Peptidase S8/S53 domain-containing protein n=1 Tax=Aaosphaeria arxii CBS 175.79 TaxID=1450172 RepID=A0A6A5XC21_9PLEO|nr:uncharacterized protein BU24DRAFT_496494 [Aaosphaeria arxii CBS 175.79]KAF2010508.1 hypothetical protein BU24DRAFT_496494 [Aaosphaeria arxii CBS 175.79]
MSQSKGNRPLRDQDKLSHLQNKSQLDSGFDEDQKKLFLDLMAGRPVDMDGYSDEVLAAEDYEGRNLLYRIIFQLKRKKKEKNDIVSPSILALVDRIVTIEPEILTQDIGNGTLLTEAADSRPDIFFRLLDLLLPDQLRTCLDISGNECDQNCSLAPFREHVLIQKYHRHRISPSSELDDKKVNDQDEMAKVTEIANDNEAACLHYEIDMDKVKKMDSRLRTVILGSPEKLRDCLRLLIRADNLDPGSNVTAPPVIPLQSFKRFLPLCASTTFESAVSEGLSPLQLAVQLFRESKVDYTHLFLIVESLVEISPTSIYFSAGDNAGRDKGKTAYRMLGELGLKTGVNEPVERKNSRLKAVELLKETCIGLPQEDLDKKLKYLYSDNEEGSKRIGLNLLSETERIDKDYVSKVRNRSKMHFETILASVRLPYWNPQHRTTFPLSIFEYQAGEITNTLAPAVDPYVGIFDWLRSRGVGKIFTVEVDDMGTEPHSNAAIRDCLRPEVSKGSYKDLNIEVFNWKKHDICSHTVLAAAPNAREVYLYSSGNTAVLRGWAHSSDFGQMKNLEKIYIKIYATNASDLKDCEDFKDDFKCALARNCMRLKKDDIEISLPDPQSSQDGGGMNESRAENDPIDDDDGFLVQNSLSPDDWINGLAHFKQFVQDMANKITDEKKRPTVRVAILDDGVSLRSLAGNDETGKSFRGDKVEYWVGSCSHGTQMMQCIRKLCPMAQLYIGRLDDSRQAEYQKFTTDSCARALEWAGREADIISMSWSFKKKGERRDEGEDKFNGLLKTISEGRDAVIFASLPDKGANANILEYLPVGHEKSGVIKIGSTNRFGAEAPENILAKRDFLLPGEEIEISPGEKEYGSSYATAFAAGLAALMLYCLKVHQALEEDYNDRKSPLALNLSNEDLVKRVKEARTLEGMKSILKVLSVKSATAQIPDKGFFLRPSVVLGKRFGDNDGQQISKLREICSKILPLGENIA